jgi:DeoR/GlpR family transcriptional regulator of sugar metabolism
MIKLESQGQVRRVHDGALIVTEDTGKPFLYRSDEFSRQKNAIGRKAAAMLREGETILIDAGATILALVKELACGQSGIAVLIA